MVSVSPRVSVAEILAAVANGRMSPDAAAKLIPSESKASGRLHAKVSCKGAISVYGLQRMPVTLYVGQWERLAEFVPELMEFAKANDAVLSRK